MLGHIDTHLTLLCNGDGVIDRQLGQVTESMWEATVADFYDDLEQVIALVQNPDIDLTAAIPHGQHGHTYLREVLLVIEHNAYHFGQIVKTRKLLGNWSAE